MTWPGVAQKKGIARVLCHRTNSRHALCRFLKKCICGDKKKIAVEKMN
jgi:hypothetical protein